jgi:hypothetical protein
VNPAPARSLLACLSQVPDPRGLQGRRHPLPAMLAAVVCAVLCGARGYRAIVQWLHLQDPATWHWMGFTRRPPTRNCFRDLLMRISPEAFENVLRAWMAEILDPTLSEQSLQPVSVDGKSLCGTLAAHQRAVHLLATLDQQTGCVLSQVAVPEGTNESKTALELLKGLVLQGRLVMGDAMFCQREVCEEIRAGGGHYFVVVKENQPTLLREIESAFADEAGFSPLRATRVALGTTECGVLR